VEAVKVSTSVGLKVRRINDDPQCDPLNRIHIISLANFLVKLITCLKKNTYRSKTSNLYLKTSVDGKHITALHKLFKC